MYVFKTRVNSLLLGKRPIILVTSSLPSSEAVAKREPISNKEKKNLDQKPVLNGNKSKKKQQFKIIIFLFGIKSQINKVNHHYLFYL